MNLLINFLIKNFLKIKIKIDHIKFGLFHILSLKKTNLNRINFREIKNVIIACLVDFILAS